MSTVVRETGVNLSALRIYWRTHNEHGEIPLALQSWWCACYDSTGFICSMSVDDDLLEECGNLADLLVAVADRLNVTIDVEQVKLDTIHRSAEWQRGAWEAWQDAS